MPDVCDFGNNAYYQYWVLLSAPVAIVSLSYTRGKEKDPVSWGQTLFHQVLLYIPDKQCQYPHELF